MASIDRIREHMEIIGADGVHVGTVDKVEGDRIKLTKGDGGEGGHKGHHHYLSIGLVAEVEGQRVRLTANAANAFMFEEEEDGSARTSTGTTGGGSYGASASNEGQDGPGIDWTTIGLGAAAVGAVAGAALLARSKIGKGDEFELRLQTDEDVRLISSSKVEGTPVVGRKGEHLGKIESFMVDKYSGRVAYAVMSFGGTLGFGDSLFPLPWSYLEYDVAKDGYVLDVTREQLAKAPKFTTSEAPEFTTSYRQNVSRFYSRNQG
jgi:hypothetical protein